MKSARAIAGLAFVAAAIFGARMSADPMPALAIMLIGTGLFAWAIIRGDLG